MEWAMLILGLVNVAERIYSGSGNGTKKKKAVSKAVNNFVKTGVDSGKLRGDWNQVTPDFVDAAIDTVVSVANDLGWGGTVQTPGSKPPEAA